MSRRKRPDAIESHERNRSIRYAESRKVAEEFPQVKHIRLVLTFEDFDEKVPPERRELQYSPESRAFFELNCPFRECVLGGFDFSSIVHEAIRNRSSAASGTKKCAGGMCQ